MPRKLQACSLPALLLLLHYSLAQQPTSTNPNPTMFSSLTTMLSDLQGGGRNQSLESGGATARLVDQMMQMQTAIFDEQTNVLRQFCTNYGAMALLDNMYFASKSANPILANLFGSGIAQTLDMTVGRIGPLGRVFLDRSCAPFTEQYQDSLAAYLSGGTLANTTLGQLVKPFAGRLDDYYVAAQRDNARQQSSTATPGLAPRFISSSADGGGGALFGGDGLGLQNMFQSTALGDSGWGGEGGMVNALLNAWGDLPDLMVPSEELQELQGSLAQSPVLIQIARMLGDANANILTLLQNIRPNGGRVDAEGQHNNAGA